MHTCRAQSCRFTRTHLLREAVLVSRRLRATEKTSSPSRPHDTYFLNCVSSPVSGCNPVFQDGEFENAVDAGMVGPAGLVGQFVLRTRSGAALEQHLTVYTKTDSRQFIDFGAMLLVRPCVL